jgi:hypothetical protein
MAYVGVGITLKGIVKGLLIQGKGHVMWAIPDNSGQLVRGIKVPAYYVPKACVRLLSVSDISALPVCYRLTQANQLQWKLIS